MQNSKSVISALPLIADALGRKYGVKVSIGGERAFTDGKNIHLPSLPLDADENVLNLTRGYLDHEAAHLRTTDFEAIKAANLSPIEKHVWNLFEDYMVEQKLAALYPGCKINFDWLIRHLFLGQITDENENGNSPVNHIFNWMLYCLRSLPVPELGDERDKLANLIDGIWPDLRQNLDLLVQSIPKECLNTKSCIDKAKRVVVILETYIQDNKEQKDVQDQPNQENSSCQNEVRNQEGQKNNCNDMVEAQRDEQTQPETSPAGDKTVEAQTTLDPQDQKDSTNESVNSEDDASEAAVNPIQILEEALANPEKLDKLDIGSLAGKELERMEDEDVQDKLTVAIPVQSQCKEYKAEEIREIRQETAALRTRLNALLQAKNEARTHISRSGKVDLRRIGRLTCMDTRIFTRRATRQGINTAIHILLDASYSMDKEKMELASKAAYALASALDNVRGVNFGVTAFPAPPTIEKIIDHVENASVAIVKRHGQGMHDYFKVECCGGTPLAEALWWVLQEMKPLKEQRKIVLIISDGYPDNIKMAKEAIAALKTHSFEVYGIGIETPAMTRLLPEERSCAIYHLQELVPAVFDLLKSALLKTSRGDYESSY